MGRGFAALFLSPVIAVLNQSPALGEVLGGFKRPCSKLARRCIWVTKERSKLCGDMCPEGNQRLTIGARQRRTPTHGVRTANPKACPTHRSFPFPQNEGEETF